MNKTLMLINKYLSHNDLFNNVSFIGGAKGYCKVQMALNAELYKFIKFMKQITNCRISLKLNKSTDEGIITFKVNRRFNNE